MKRLPAVLTLAALLVAGCAGDRADSVVDAEALVIAVRYDLPSIGYRNAKGGLEGYDVDVGRYIARRLGKPVTFMPVSAAEREQAVTSGRADLVLATYTISMDRKQRVLFAGPYHISYQDILVRRDETSIGNVRDLKGRRICEVRGSNAAQRVVEEREVAARVVPFPDYASCLAALKEGRVDAITTNDVILAGLAIQDGSGLRLVNARFNEQRTGVGMRKGDVEGCEEVNRAITAMYQDGTAGRLLQRWFGRWSADLATMAVPQFEGCS